MFYNKISMKKIVLFIGATIVSILAVNVLYGGDVGNFIASAKESFNPCKNRSV